MGYSAHGTPDQGDGGRTYCVVVLVFNGNDDVVQSPSPNLPLTGLRSHFGALPRQNGFLWVLALSLFTLLLTAEPERVLRPAENLSAEPERLASQGRVLRTAPPMPVITKSSWPGLGRLQGLLDKSDKTADHVKATSLAKFSVQRVFDSTEQLVSLEAPSIRTAGLPLTSSLSTQVISAAAKASDQAPAPVKPEPANDGRLVLVLDPGHGGVDPGSLADNGLIEKHLTLDIARRLQAELNIQLPGLDVVLTRETDEGLSRQDRVSRITAARADLMVSLHFNTLPQKDVNLVETYYAGPQNIIESWNRMMTQSTRSRFIQSASEGPADYGHTRGSAVLGHILQGRLHRTLREHTPDIGNAGVKRDTLFVLTRVQIPAVLVELGCLSNPQEAERLMEDEHRHRIVEALASGIRDYLRHRHGDEDLDA